MLEEIMATILATITLLTLLGCLVAMTIFAIKHEAKLTKNKNKMYEQITKYLENRNKENK